MKKAILTTTSLMLVLLAVMSLTACDNQNDKYPKDYLGFEKFLENYTFERGVESREITLKVIAAEKQTPNVKPPSASRTYQDDNQPTHYWIKR